MSTAAQVELYVSQRPYLRRALAEGIVNYSQLARKICQEEDLDSLGAIKMALSRLEDYLAQSWSSRRDKVKQILNRTEIEIKDGVAVEKADSYDQEALIAAKTSHGFTLIKQGGGKSLVTLTSPIELETTAGVIEFILSSLAAKGINVDQLISCREDTQLVVNSDQAPKVLETLQERLS